MIVHDGYENLKLKLPVVTVGVFDGVHLGHRALIKYLVSRTAETGGESVVITFEPHPRLVINENSEEVFFLSSPEEKKNLLAGMNIEHLIVIRFDKAFSKINAEDFIGKILVDKIGVKYLLVGYDNHIGRGKTGDLNSVRKCAEIYGFEVEKVKETTLNDSSISSTAIRKALIDGRLDEANMLLGYDYSLTGIVVKGRRLGRSLGFPTANIKPVDSHKLVPGNGVYAVEVIYNEEVRHGMLSIGYNPTVSKEKVERSVEVHIFDFDNDLYNQNITVVFKFRLRDERKFESLKHLTDQMELDKQAALRLLSRTKASN